MRTRNKSNAVALKSKPVARSNKHPLAEREHPLARDARGAARREEIRAKTPMVSAPRQSLRRSERSNQQR